ncbi:MAG TPA: DNA-protecting protein DprA [Gammaproteobacteria bacterium]|nr:DNA-protecting protein DprA [Gammaproteobacteria bacterium]
MDETTLRAWLVLNRAPGVGTRTFTRLLDHFGTPDAILAAPLAVLAGLGLGRTTLDYFSHPDADGVASDLRWLAAAPEHGLLTCRDAAYPARLAQIADPPPLLFLRGDPSLLERDPMLAVVGSRTPSASGEELATQMAAELASAGCTIVSGLAAGIDGAAHRGALSVGGASIGVLGTGPDRIYPARHRRLARQMVECGLLVSEFPPGTRPLPHHFPRRNRIISGLCQGVLVVEAAQRSGSLITAEFAVEQGREVFAVPGSPRNARARGTNDLLRQGALLAENVADVLHGLGLVVQPECDGVHGSEPTVPADLPAAARQLLAVLDSEPVTPDLLVTRCGLTAEAVSSMLLLLELQGLVKTAPGAGVYRAL